MIKTKLCEMIGIEHPIVQAGMGPWNTEKLAIAAANAGILGIISSAGARKRTANEFDDRSDVKERYEIVKQLIRNVAEGTREKKGIFGVNSLVSVEIREIAKILIQAVIDAREEDPDVKERLRVMITSAGDPLPLTDIIKPSGLKWFHVVPSVRHAQRCERAGVDIIIVSGHEAGGHAAWEPVHSMVLLPAVAKAVNTPVIGAGGFCDGATLVAALALGACGVQMGTRFIATQESDFVRIWKNRVLKSGERDTLAARGFVGPLRYLKNQASIALTELTLKKTPRLYLGEPDMSLDPDIREEERRGMNSLNGDDDEAALFFGGEVAGRVEDVPTVKELVERIVKEGEEIIASLPNVVESA
jgi:NAD(P)H-dependent flavin oxidoreductase YrpB (nitropropane dioxygenase family)